MLVHPNINPVAFRIGPLEVHSGTAVGIVAASAANTSGFVGDEATAAPAVRVVDAFGHDVFETVIGRTVKFPDASVAAAPITSFAPDHQAADSYRQLARELVARGAVA